MAKIGRLAVNDEEAVAFLNRNGADVTYLPAYRSPADATRCMHALLAEIEFRPVEQTRVFVHGRWRDTPRRITAYGESGSSYRYSGCTVPTTSWASAPTLLAERDALVAATAFRPTYVLINLYPDGRASISPHSDAERDLGPEPMILSQTFGAVRPFRFRRRDAAVSEVPPVTLELAHGSLLIMRHPTNSLSTHALAKAGGAHPERVGPRLNLTWRRVIATGADDGGRFARAFAAA